MATSLLQLRIDDNLKKNAANVYAKLGLDLPTAIRMFLTRSVLDNGVPFSMTLPKESYKATKGLNAMMEISKEAERNGTFSISEEEIEEEIEDVRKRK